MNDSQEELAAAAMAAVTASGLGWHRSNHGPAAEDALASCEQRIEMALPSSYRDFLKHQNGVELGLDLAPFVRSYLTLLSSDEIAERTLEQRAIANYSFPEESFDGLIVFADTMDGDVCLFDRSQERDGRVPVLAGHHEEDPDLWRETVIAADFDQWLRNVLLYVTEHGDHDDFRYWWARDWTVRS